MQRRILSMGWSLYAAPSYLAAHGRPVSATDFGGHLVVGYDTPMSGVPGAIWLEAHASHAQIVMRADSLMAVASATAMGMGLSVLHRLRDLHDSGNDPGISKSLAVRIFDRSPDLRTLSRLTANTLVLRARPAQPATGTEFLLGARLHLHRLRSSKRFFH